MKNTRKLLCLALALMLCISVLLPVAQAEERPHVTFTAITPGLGATDPADPANAQTIKRIEEDYNVTIDVQIGPADMNQYQQQLRLMALSDSLPDIIIPWNMQGELATEGFLLPLDELVAEYAPNAVEAFTQKQMDNMRGGEDRMIYSLPYFMNGVFYVFYMRGDWLDNLGLEPPTTIEEYEEVFTAFTFDDPDGNGIDDTYGLGERPVSIAFLPIFGAYGLTPPAGGYVFQDDGTVIYTLAHPRMFPFLETVSRWYANGILDPEWVTDIGDVYYNKVYGGKHGSVILTLGGRIENENLIKANNPDAYLVGVTPPVGPDGYSGMKDMGVGSWPGVCLNRNIKNPERFIEIYNDMFDYEKAIFYQLGEEGVDYELIEGGGYTVLATSEDVVNKGIGFFTNNFVPYPKDMIPQLMDGTTLDIYNRYNGVIVELPMMGWDWSEESKAVAQDVGDINSILLEGMYSVICGKNTVEEYQNFIDEWWANGGDRMTEVVNNEYQAKLAAQGK